MSTNRTAANRKVASWKKTNATARPRRIWDHPVLGKFEDRGKVCIDLDGLRIEAYEGDSVAAALWAQEVRVFNQSEKFHEPRGPACMIGLCNCCNMTVNGRPNVRTCITPVRDGMKVSVQSKRNWKT